MNNPAPSALPAAAQARLDKLQAEASNSEAPTNTAPTVVAAPTPSGDSALPRTDGVDSERVTMSREDYNALKTTAAKADRAALELLELDELRHRLTQLEAQGKAVGEAPNAAVPAAPAAPAAREKVSLQGERQAITAEEQEQFGESQAYVEKIATNKVLDMLGPILDKLNGQLDGIASKADGVESQFVQTQERSFQAELRKAVPNLDAIIKHTNWGLFLDEVEPLSGATYEQLLGHHISKRNLNSLVNVYKAFQAKYMGNAPEQVNEGYAGAAPSGTSAAPQITDPNNNKKLKLSDRRKASEDFRKGRITWDQLEAVNKAFKEAEAKGLVDINS